MGIKVLHLIDSGGLYGAEKMLLSLVQEQVKQGLAPMILSAGEPHIEEKPIEAEAKRLALPVMTWRMKPGFNLKESWRVVKWARNNGYDLLHSHGYKFNVLLGLFPLWLRQLPLVSTLHGYVNAKRLTKSWAYECVDRFAIRRMQGVVAVSQIMKEQMPKGFRSKTQFIVIPNGIDIGGVQATSRETLDDTYSEFLDSHTPIILGVGRLSSEKGFDRLVHLFMRLKNSGNPNAGLVIVGDGKLRRAIEVIADQAGIRRHLLMPGYFNNVPALMARSDLYIISSHTEGLPISLLEAMAVGLPVLASRVGDIPVVVGECKDKVLAEFANIEGVVRQSNEILKNDLLRQEIVELLGKRVSEQYSVVKMAGKYKQFYSNVLAGNTQDKIHAKGER